MASLAPKSPSPYAGLPASPRANRQMLSPINTTFPSQSSRTPSPSPYSDSTPNPNEKQTQGFVNRPRRASSMIFVNATIPLSPASTSSNNYDQEQPFDGLAPRKRSGFARLFCCFGREERARRRAARYVEYEKVGESCHWTEL